MIVLVCGGRDYDDKEFLYSELTKIHSTGKIELLIEGGARGADCLAKCWAIDNEIHYIEFPANWNLHGKKAGFIRNQQMLDTGRPDLVVAFHGGNGTADMIRRSKKARIYTIQCEKGLFND